MLVTAGRALRVRYAAVTDVSLGLSPFAPVVSSAFHCRKRADGLPMRSPSFFVSGPAQSLHDSSGRSVLPDRVYSRTGPEDSHRIVPHDDALFVSRTGETYTAGDWGSGPMEITRPGFAV